LFETLVVTFGALGREYFGVRTAGLAGGALAALMHAELDFWHTGQPETYGGMLTAFALLATARWRRLGPELLSMHRLLGWCAVGVLFGMAFLLKPPLGGGAVVCAAYLGRGEVDRTGERARALAPILVVGAASVVPSVLMALWFWWLGAWPALAWTFFDFVPGYSAIGWAPSPISAFYYGFVEVFTGFSLLLPAFALAAFVLAPTHGREREGLFLVLGVICMHPRDGLPACLERAALRAARNPGPTTCGPARYDLRLTRPIWSTGIAMPGAPPCSTGNSGAISPSRRGPNKNTLSAVSGLEIVCSTAVPS
jgi:hypothetical protein